MQPVSFMMFTGRRSLFPSLLPHPSPPLSHRCAHPVCCTTLQIFGIYASGCIPLPSTLTLNHNGANIGTSDFSVYWGSARSRSYGLPNRQTIAERCGLGLDELPDITRFNSGGQIGHTIMRHFFSCKPLS